MKIRMLTHYSRGADGIHSTHYNIGQKYDLPESEAQLFISIGVAVEDKDISETLAHKEAWVPQDNYAPIFAAPEQPKSQKKRRK